MAYIVFASKLEIRKNLECALQARKIYPRENISPLNSDGVSVLGY